MSKMNVTVLSLALAGAVAAYGLVASAAADPMHPRHHTHHTHHAPSVMDGWYPMPRLDDEAYEDRFGFPGSTISGINGI